MLNTLEQQVRHEIRAAVEDTKMGIAISERSRKNRSCALAAAAYAWLASVADDIFTNYKYRSMLEPYMFSMLARLWPKSWDPTSLVIHTRRQCLLNAAALILMELEELDANAD